MALELVRQAILAMMQGLTEIFPVSSSLHVLVYGTILGTHISLGRLIFFHLGTALAIAACHRQELAALASGRYGLRLPLLIVVALGATIGISLLVRGVVSTWIAAERHTMALLWVPNGVVIILAARYARGGSRRMVDLTFEDALLIGVVQGLTVIPGLSRLGLTLVITLLRGMSWSEGLRFSFLLSLPTILAANLYLLLSEDLPAPPALLASCLSYLEDVVLVGLTFLIGIVAIRVLTRVIVLGRPVLHFFGIYCLTAGLFFALYLRLFE